MRTPTLETMERTDEARGLAPRAPRTDMLGDILAGAFPWSGEIDAKLLWVRGDVSFYRVNWWRTRPGAYDHYIAHSAFVSIAHGADEPVILDSTHPPAPRPARAA